MYMCIEKGWLMALCYQRGLGAVKLPRIAPDSEVVFP